MGRVEVPEFSHYFIEGKEQLLPLRIIALEGPVCAGKTTLLRMFANDGYTTVSEYAEYANHGRGFPSFPPKTPKEALDNFRFFLEVEERRFGIIQQKEFRKDDLVIIDRSVFTLLAFEYAAPAYTGFSVFNEAWEIIRNSDKVLTPFKILYLEIDDETIAQRFAQKDSFCAEVFLRPEFNAKIREFFQVCCEVMPDFFVKIENSKRTPREAYWEIKRFL